MPTDHSKLNTGPYAGLTILDLSHVLCGPFCTRLFADLGARVIKVERPKIGDDTREFGPFLNGKSVYFSFINRGKESIALDFRNDDDRKLLIAMVRHADVIVENFRPGAMDRLRLGYTELSAINPRLIYASISGFGQTGPLSQDRAYDTVIQGFSGIMSVTGFHDGPATRVGTSIADLTAGLFGFAAIASALYARERTGKGAKIDVAMLDSMLTLLEHGVMEYVAAGRISERLGNRHPFITPFDTFRSADDAFIICAGDDELFKRMCEAIGMPGLAGDRLFATNTDRTANHAALKQALESVFVTKPSSHWLDLIRKAGVPCGPIHTVAEAIEHPQTMARNMIIEAGGIKMPGNPLKIAGYDDPATRPAAPELDADGERIRKEFAGG
ncbi:MAG TPA: CoA:oxalate CoA-transferase [Candidatus Binataceae bacterium]|nr:CoA:oxalate CoA-transferase [Candidatus Binataceae bacterium]